MWLADVELLSAGFGPLWLPPTNARCVVLVPVFKYNSFGVIYDAVKGRTIKSSLVKDVYLRSEPQDEPFIYGRR